MLKYLTIVVLCILLPATARGELTFSATSVALGTIRGGQALAHTFPFHNSGAEEIEIVEVRPGCGCLAPKLSATHFKPNEKGQLRFDLRTLGQAAGPHTWTAQVRYRCGDDFHEVPLRISAHLINDIQLQPASLRLIARGPMTQELTLLDTRPQPLRVEHVHTSTPFLKARVLNQSKNADGHRVIKLAVELTSQCKPGEYSESVALETNDAEYRRLIVPVAVTMNSAAPLTAHPASVEVNVPAGAAALTRFVRVSSSMSGPVVIERVTADHPALSCTHARGPAHAATIRVRIDPGRVECDLQTTLQVHITAPHPTVVQIPVAIRVE